MFSEVLKLIPKLDPAALGNLERSLNGRFAKVAKKFGSGIVQTLKGGAIAGAVIALVSKILNPLKDVQEAVDKTLARGDDLSTYAKQFNTTAGNLAKLQAFGKATGLDPEGVRMLMVKFQSAVAQAAVDPEGSAVAAYVGKKDTAEAFFEFVQALQKMNATQQSLVQQNVFGERQILKASEFLSADFKKLQSLFGSMGAPGTNELTQAAEWLGTMSDNRDAATAVRELKDLRDKSKLINDGTINSLNARDDFAMVRENQNLSQFQRLERLQIAADKIAANLENLFNKGAPWLAPLLEAIPKLVAWVSSLPAPTALKAVTESRVIRGLTPGKDK